MRDEVVATDRQLRWGDAVRPDHIDGGEHSALTQADEIARVLLQQVGARTRIPRQ